MLTTILVKVEGNAPAQGKTLCKAKERHDPHVQVFTAKDEVREKAAHNANLRQSQRRDTRVTHVLT